MREIVIKIPDKLYEYIVKGKDLSEEQNDEITLTIADGTPLPKDHGDLVDADATFIKLNERIHAVDVMTAQYEPYSNNEIPLWMWSAIIEDTKIIKADKEST